MQPEQQNALLKNWLEQQELAERMTPIIGKLYRDRGIVLRLYGRPINNVSTIDLLKAHRFVKQYEPKSLSITDSFQMVEALAEMELAPARVDLGKLTVEYLKLPEPRPTRIDYLRKSLTPIVDRRDPLLKEPQDVVLYGFGRIGRILARLLIERTGAGNKMRLRAIVVRKGSDDDLQKRASLLRRDSVHGPFNGSIYVLPEESGIVANGNFIKVIYSNDPGTVDYTKYGIKNAIVVDNTGKWRDVEGLSQHLKCPGVAKVVLTAPGKGDMKNIVYGVNDKMIEAGDKIISAASCTTNAITPVLKVMHENFGVANGHVETVHSYTNDQNLIDNFHKGARRGRAAALNMVITETGAAKAVAKALPELKDKLSGSSIRVPTPNVSLAVLNLNLEKETSKEEVNALLRDVALNSKLMEQIDYTASTELVSTDLVGSRHAGVVDSTSTIANGKSCVLYVWYDNEMGYSCQVVRIVQEMAGLRFPNLPAA